MNEQAIEKLLPLREAAPMVNLSVGQLRRAIDRGDLEPVRLGTSIFVTQSGLQGMIAKCRGNQKARASTGMKKSKPGSSGTASNSGEQDVALARLKLLSEGSQNTSRKNGNPKPKNTAQVLRFSGTS